MSKYYVEPTPYIEFEGDILPPDPQQLDASDPNAPVFQPFRNRDKESPHDASTVYSEDESEPVQSNRLNEAGQLDFRSPMPQDLKDWKEAHRTNPTKRIGETAVYLSRRGFLDK